MPKTFAREPFCVVFQKTSGSENITDQRGAYQVFSSGKLCLRVPKTSVGEHFRAVFEKTCGSEKLHG